MLNTTTARLLDIIDELDANNYESVEEIETLVANRYGELFLTAITEGWTDGTDLHGCDIVRLTESPEVANKIVGAFDDEVYDLFESCLGVIY